jgi:hypothetical protein
VVLAPLICVMISPVLSWSPDLVLISVFVSVGAGRFRFTKSLLLVVVPWWTGFELFLSSHQEQARTDGEEPELPSSLSAAVLFTGQVPFALLLRGSRLMLLLSMGANLHLCRSLDLAVFPSPACPVADLSPAPVCHAVPFFLWSFIPVASILPRELGLLLLGSASGLVLQFHCCRIFLPILSSCSASRPVSPLATLFLCARECS